MFLIWFIRNLSLFTNFEVKLRKIIRKFIVAFSKLFAFIVYVKVYELKAAPLYLHFISQKTRNQNKTAARKGVKERGRLGVATHSKIGGPLSRALSMSLSSFRTERLIIKRALCGPFVRVVTALLLTLLDQFHVFFFFILFVPLLPSRSHTHMQRFAAFWSLFFCIFPVFLLLCACLFGKWIMCVRVFCMFVLLLFHFFLPFNISSLHFMFLHPTRPTDGLLILIRSTLMIVTSLHKAM